MYRKIKNTRRVLLLINALLVTCLMSFAVAAQTSSTDGSTPLALQPGAPAGAYPLSGFENVNLYSGGLSFQLPLLSISGRGGAQMPVMLPIENKWRVSVIALPQPDGSFNYRYLPIQAWWENFDRRYMAGTLMGRQSGQEAMQCPDNATIYALTLTRLTFTAPDGTEYELRDQLTGGQPSNNTNCNNYLNPPSRGTVFVTSDGSAATFISDSPITDSVLGANPGEIFPWGYLMLKDGTRFRIEDGLARWMRDRNGNKLTFGYDTSNRVQTITDSLNRQITISRNTGPGTFDQITYKGFGGVQRIVKVNYSSLANALRSDYPSTMTPKALFPELNGSNSTQHNPSVISSITLPNNKEYQIKYNPYGEIARVVLPTGGAIEYDRAGGVGIGWESSLVIIRRLIERRVYPDGASGSAYASRSTYSLTESVGTNTSYVIVDQLTNTGTLLARSKHYFFGVPSFSFLLSPVEYPGWKESREYQTEEFASNGTTVLRRTANTWQQRQASGWWGPGSDTSPPNDPRLSETTTTLVDTNQVSKQTFSYDDTVPFNNQSDVYEYNFGSGTPGPLVRRTHTDYLKTNPVNSVNYTTTSIHIRNLPTQTQVFDPSGIERARTTFEYDNYATVPLEPRSNISGLDSGFTTSYVTRGNLTRATNWILSTSTQLHSYNQYDVAGSVVKMIDARGFETTFKFDDRYGAPDTEAQGNTAPSELSGQTSYAFATKVTNAAGHISYAQFDYYLGKPVNGEDPNGVVASGSYNDSLDRPTQIRRGISTLAENQTTFAYDDTLRIVTTSSDQDAVNDNIRVTKVVYDQMGRTIEQRQYEGGANYIVIETLYDALGRAHKTSNPYRRWLNETAVWTTRVFDGLGRVLSVTTPDNAAVSTSYSGNSVTVTDPASKRRKSVADALGRLIEVYEDPLIPGGPTELDYQTTYTYDVLDNLVKVTQGAQQRFFMYDSLKRLIRARNPEQGTNGGLALSDPITVNSAWSIGYDYDANGNLTQKTDARGVVSTYVYDVLNRNTTTNYSDTPLNPDVTRFYDGAINGKGRFWYFYSNGDFSNGPNTDSTAIDSYDALGRPLVQRQLYKVNNVWNQTYQTTRTYNRAGAVKTQTYPSLHSVTYNYDPAGRVADNGPNLAFTGNLGDGVLRTYASSFIYNSRNQITQELFGTQMQLYHKLQYNIRGQLWDVRVSTGPDINGSWNRGCLQFFYESTLTHGASGPDNNGNVLKSSHYIPNDQGAALAIPHQLYTYDSLNRLTSVAEYFISDFQPLSQTSLQSYTYDRWGNRTINAAQTWGTGINNKQFDVDTTTNRLTVPSGQSGVMTYDAAGNLTTDTYTGVGTRTYDAENRMTTAADNTGQTSRYAYDADGHRVRRQVAGSQEEWQVYGFDDELLAEYRATSPASSPEKEYGYRNGELLVTATGRFNVALAANGAVATASSAHTCCGFSTTGAINGNNRGPWGNGEGWNDATPDTVPDWIQVDFSGSKTIDEISVFSLHDNYTQENTPTETQTFTLYGLLAFDVQYWNGSSWTTIPGGSVSANNKVWRKFTFSPITTSKIRVWINAVPDSWSRVVEIQAFGTSASGEKVQWLVPDHLGTPRIVLDQTGSLVGVKRHDYLPFGEELFAPAGGRNTTMGYTAGDGVRQQFTKKERDVETGLDYFLARYYSSNQGRFISVDPGNAQGKADPANPQGWNGYSYVTNNPLTLTDPDGRLIFDPEMLQRIRNYLRYLRPVTDAQLAEEVKKKRDELKANLRAMDGHEYSEQDFDQMTIRQVLWTYDRYRFGIDAGVARIDPPAPVAPAPAPAKNFVIGKVSDLSKPGALRPGEQTLDLPNQGNPRANWEQNAGRLREVMREGQPIRDASVNPNTGALRDNSGFLRAERNLLKSQGWRYNSTSRMWHPPGK